MIDDGGCGAIGEMSKPVPVPFCHHKSHMTWSGLEPSYSIVSSCDYISDRVENTAPVLLFTAIT
jgi:hypothetical protein